MTLTQLGLPLEPPLNFVRHPRARRYVVRVRADGTVRVTIPRWGSRREAEAFVAAERPWIHKQLARVAEERQGIGERVSSEDVRAWKKLAARTLPVRLLELAGIHRLKVTAISIRDQRWRWGSCSRTGRICLNWRLLRMPEWIRDYVMLHELMHLKRMDHSPAFWSLVAAACPDYLAARRWLREHPTGLS